MESLLILGSLLLLFLTFKYLVQPAFLSPLSRIPCAHFTSCFSNGWILWQRYSCRENRAIHDAHQRLGPIVRLGATELSVNSVDALKTVYSDDLDKDVFYSRAFDNYGIPNMFSMIQRKPHSERKRMFANIYSKSVLQSSPVIRELSEEIVIKRLLPIIEAAAQDGKPLNVLEYSAAVNMDFISSFVFGLQNGADFLVDTKTRKRWLAGREITKGHGFWPLEFPVWTSFLRKIGIHLEPPQIHSARKEVKDLCLDMLQRLESSANSSENSPGDHKTSTWTKPVVYEQLLSQLSPSAGKPSSVPLPVTKFRLMLASELMDHVLAGTDTNAWTLSYIMHELSQRPNLQSSLCSELLSLSPPIIYPQLVMKSNEASQVINLPPPRSIDALPLLDAIVLETLRLRPAVPGSQPRITPFSAAHSPISLCGYSNIPGGIRVSAQAYSLHRNKEVFPEPEVWKPERWLDASREKRDEMMRWFWAFGSGGRMCIGNHLAMIELKLVVAAIYTNYTTTIVDDEDIEQLDSYSSGPKADKLILQFKRTE